MGTTPSGLGTCGAHGLRDPSPRLPVLDDAAPVRPGAVTVPGEDQPATRPQQLPGAPGAGDPEAEAQPTHEGDRNRSDLDRNHSDADRSASDADQLGADSDQRLGDAKTDIA